MAVPKELAGCYNLAAIFAHSDFSPKMKVRFSVGVQLFKLGKYFLYFGVVLVSDV